MQKTAILIVAGALLLFAAKCIRWFIQGYREGRRRLRANQTPPQDADPVEPAAPPGTPPAQSALDAYLAMWTKKH